MQCYGQVAIKQKKTFFNYVEMLIKTQIHTEWTCINMDLFLCLILAFSL